MKNENRVILGIDPGYDRCGVAILGGNIRKPEVLFSCCIETSKTKTFPARIEFIFNALNQIIQKWQPNEIAIENLFITTNQKTAMRVSEARGVCLLAGQINRLKLAEYTPLQVKTYLTSYGKADKNQVYFIVEKILKLDFSDKDLEKQWKNKHDDEIDAIAIALTHLYVGK